MRVKICGITNLNDALDVVKAKADAIGFVFFEKSPRYITPLEAKKIVEKLPPFVQTVGLFVNENQETIDKICKISGMQLAQIYDDENIVDYKNLDVKYIKVLRVKQKDDLKKIKDEYILIDAFVEGFGGKGKRLPLEWFEDVDLSKVVVAGGLDAENLKELRGYNFFGVDVSSGVEESKGKKSKEKIFEFVKVANEI